MEFECIDRDLIDSHNNNLEVKMEEMNNDVILILLELIKLLLGNSKC